MNHFHRPTRRDVLRASIAGGLGLSVFGNARAIALPVPLSDRRFGPLGDPDENGIMLPPGFRARTVAITGETVGRTGHVWHPNPDGGACFPTPDRGWVYVSNSETARGGGGVGALRFDARGELLDAYTILTGTTDNCAGGPTPWGSWLSCEEHPRGQVWECNPLKPGSQGVVRPAMGAFEHEAAAVDPVEGVVYLTEDDPEGLFYRFRPTAYPDLETGILEALEVLDPDGEGPIRLGQERPVAWHRIPDPRFSGDTPTRKQVESATAFRGGEGCWHAEGQVWFSTKYSNRIWRYTPSTGRLKLVYDLEATPDAPLSGVDNVFVSPTGDVYVAEDGGDMELVALTTDGQVVPILRVVQEGESEIAGPCLTPDGSRLYFSSQRAPGRTFEVTGPFVGPIGGGAGQG